MLPATRAFYDLERLWSMRPGDAQEDQEDERHLLGDID
jgi:ribosome-associated protein